MHGEGDMHGRGACVGGGHCVWWGGACVAGETATAAVMHSCLSGEYFGYFQKLASGIEPMKRDLEVRMVYDFVRKELLANYSITSGFYYLLQRIDTTSCLA